MQWWSGIRQHYERIRLDEQQACDAAAPPHLPPAPELLQWPQSLSEHWQEGAAGGVFLTQTCGLPLVTAQKVCVCVCVYMYVCARARVCMCMCVRVLACVCLSVRACCPS